MTRIVMVQPKVGRLTIRDLQDPGTADLLSRYKCNDPGPSVAADSGLIGANGVLYGDPAYLTFTGEGITCRVVGYGFWGALSIGSGSQFAPLTGGSATFMVWVRPILRNDASPTPYTASMQFAPNAFCIGGTIGSVAPSDATAWFRGLGANVWSDNGGGSEIEWGCNAGGAQLPVVRGVAQAGQWIHLAAVYDVENTRSTLYINGEEAESVGVVPVFSTRNYKVGAVGSLAGSTQQAIQGIANATIADARAYDRVLTAGEIRFVHTMGRNP